MLILSQTKDMTGYHGTVGTPTNMYDYGGRQLFVGDVVGLTTEGINGKKAYDHGIEFVCEENPEIANYTNQKKQYVMGISDTYNNARFSVLDNFKHYSDQWREALYDIDPEWRVFKVKDWSRLVEGETIGFLSVVRVDGDTN